MQTTEKFTCIAHLEREIERIAATGNLQAGNFGNWISGGLVLIKGRWLSKGMFGGWCVRWTTEHMVNGLFSKGLACYPRIEKPERIAHLPVVK